MLCVTGNESSVDALAKRVEQGLARGQRAEVRLDLLSNWDDSVFGLLRQNAGQLIVACRPVRQGGQFRGSEHERFALLRRAAAHGVGYLDLEADTKEADLRAVLENYSGKLILSWHNFGEETLSQLAQRAAEMDRRADIIKLATTTDDAGDLIALRAIHQQSDHPTILIGMGSAGLLSRCRYTAFGSPWTYVSLEESTRTASGQLSLAQAASLGLPESTHAPFLCLIGGEQAIHSPGMKIYNQLFRRRELPWSYVTIVTQRADEIIAFVRELGALGASITMPHKQAAYESGQPDSVGRKLGAVNTLRFNADQIESTNTDVVGVREPLVDAMKAHADRHAFKRALVLGAGGAARAAAFALAELGLTVTLAARQRQRAEATIKGFGTAVDWDARTSVEAEVLINATPVAGAASPWPSDRPLEKAIVFDLALNPEPSSLLEKARSERATPIEARSMWVHQGAAQMNWITGKPFAAQELLDGL